MQQLFSHIKGDKSIWAIVALMAIFSFMPVFSASSNLAYLNGGDGNTISYLIKHFIHLGLGFGLMYAVHKVPLRYFKGISLIMLPLVVVLLIITLAQGTTIGGANASRWISIPIVNLSFQTSSLASVVLLVYVARYLAKYKDRKINFKQSIVSLWLPVFAVVGLVLPANFSTAALLFFMVILVVYIGKYPLKYLGLILGIGVVMLSIFVLTAKAFPGLFPNRVDTWMSRIENFSEPDGDEQYQVEKAKIAIATGGLTGNGIGKSVQRHFLPQSSSDFIYAIIVEEMGLIGGLGVVLAYLFLLFRISIVASKSYNFFGKLITIAVGLPIIFQALINMSVAVELLPVTGQTLPLISSGGSSIWMTCISVGIILSVSNKEENEPNEEVSLNENSNNDNPLEVLSETI
ncbi:FtsW/RodA/SpoVE family cell cycle protein [Psychroflexus sp. ALD_RP9]|uniref:FtsW/RodA/SpoVE family cell cycle protein n=1 Tax=Psychroflexus sp. ALD_RP9 TaxID=2777186 RepID=UPI001A8C1110|nr:FtsW/RodA/SpoVE family cell cycle protein [Psychroflexus sp. ALD_RP9]QSS96506.1 FtsW/RodA/SpoVE family cell cycle protein [Psychroflexus sp. ALD_RP9]